MTPDPERRGDSPHRQFLRTFLHDLATPLSAVSLHLEGASRRFARGEDVSESLEIAKTELGRAFELFESGRELLLATPGRVETFSFDEWVESVLRAYASDGVVVAGRTGGRVAGDKEKLSEALTSLVVNAIESASSSPVSVSLSREGARLHVRVENRGILPIEDPEKLFAPRSAASGKNWGMGLARARLYAADAGGVVRLGQDGDRVFAVLALPEETA
ncbi:MAG TPA: ATP-binding protein [Thermoanaerobaculia bacterium]